jgi:pyruvate-formate lyase
MKGMKEEFIKLLNKYHKGEVGLLNVKGYIDCIISTEIAEGEINADEIVDLIDVLVTKYLEVCEELQVYKSEFM